MTQIDLFIAIGIVVGYILIQNRCLRYAKPLRSKIEKESEKLLADRRIQGEVRQSIEFMTDHAASPWIAPLAAVVGLITVIVVALRIVKVPARKYFPDEDTERKYRYIDTQFTKSIIAANPIGGLLLLNVMILVVVILAIAGFSWETSDEIKTSTEAKVNKRLHSLHSYSKAA